MSTQIQLQAQQYNAIYQVLRTNSSVEAPMSVEDVYNAAKDKVRSLQQVRDALAAMNRATPKLVHKIKEGKFTRYWVAATAPESRPNARKVARQPVDQKATAKVAGKVVPEVTIENERITVEHPNYRVVIILKQ